MREGLLNVVSAVILMFTVFELYNHFTGKHYHQRNESLRETRWANYCREQFTAAQCEVLRSLPH